MESRPTLTGRVAAAAVRGSPTWQLVTIPVRFAGAGSEGLDRPPHRPLTRIPTPASHRGHFHTQLPPGYAS
jgi:hypothetical protein